MWRVSSPWEQLGPLGVGALDWISRSAQCFSIAVRRRNPRLAFTRDRILSFPATSLTVFLNLRLPVERLAGTAPWHVPQPVR